MQVATCSYHYELHTLNYSVLNHPDRAKSSLFIIKPDKFITLDSLLIQLREKVTDKWYELGQALGVPVKVMETFKGHPSDQCMIETLDYWLRNHPDQPTWREVTQALDAIGFSELSREIAQVYVTGTYSYVYTSMHMPKIIRHYHSEDYGHRYAHI